MTLKCNVTIKQGHVIYSCGILLSNRGSKLLIEGHNLDSAHKTVLQYISKSLLHPLHQVSWLLILQTWSILSVFQFPFMPDVRNSWDTKLYFIYWSHLNQSHLFIQVCNTTMNATHMECSAPAFQEEMPEEKSDTGNISIHMDGKRDLYKSRFDYHPDAMVIPFESEDKELLLKPGDTEVSLHVCLHWFCCLCLFM